MRIRNTAPEVFRTHQQSFISRVKDPGGQCSVAISAFGSVPYMLLTDLDADP